MITVARSDFGRQLPLMSCLEESDKYELHLIVSGNHYLQGYGDSLQEIEDSGLPVKMSIPGDGDPATQSALILQQCAEYLQRESCDVFLVLGDRFETLAAAQAALLTQTPLWHIGGGYITIGAIDEQIRHAISKLADYHFVASEGCYEVLLRLGEPERSIFICGAPDLEVLHETELLDRESFCATLGLKEDRDIVLVTFHPETHADRAQNIAYMEEAQKFLVELDAQILISAPCADPGSDVVFEMIGRLQELKPDCVYRKCLGFKLFVNALSHAKCMIGNSSSGIIEAASFRLPVINVGDRQSGRECAGNVIHARYRCLELEEAYKQVESSVFMQSCAKVTNPYGDGAFCKHFLKALNELL